MMKVLILFLVICIPLIYFYAEYENDKPQLTFIEIIEPNKTELINNTNHIINQPKNETKPENKQNETTINITFTQNISQSNETPIFSVSLPKKGILNEQNSSKYVNIIDYINKNWNSIIFYTDFECYIRLNPNLKEKDWMYYITTFEIPLHYQMHENYCKYLRSDFN